MQAWIFLPSYYLHSTADWFANFLIGWMWNLKISFSSRTQSIFCPTVRVHHYEELPKGRPVEDTWKRYAAQQKICRHGCWISSSIPGQEATKAIPVFRVWDDRLQKWNSTYFRISKIWSKEGLQVIFVSQGSQHTEMKLLILLSTNCLLNFS